MNIPFIDESTVKDFKNLNFSSDFLFKKALEEDVEVCRKLLEILLHKKVTGINFVSPEHTIALAPEGRAIRMDVYVMDSDKVYDIEIQTINRPSLVLRTRYYHSLIDAMNLRKGEDYSNLKESYVIFICLNDPFPPYGLPVYTVGKGILEDETIDFDDRSHTMFYNCSGWEKSEDKEIRAFLRFVKTNEASSTFTKEIEKLVTKLKGSNECLLDYYFSKVHDYDMRWIGHEEGLAEGEKRKSLAIAKVLKNKGIPMKDIVEATELSEEEVMAL